MTKEFLLHKDKKENGNPLHIQAHLQTAQADTQPKFAKRILILRNYENG